MAKSQIGLVGLAVMGENLALNIERNGYPITVYNRSGNKTQALLAGRAQGLKFTGAETVPGLVPSLERPRRLIPLGNDGAGHFVKMIHNGIEYGDMQLIAESYEVLRQILGLEAPQLADIFADWNKGQLDSFLIEITAKVLRKKDPETGKWLVDLILDKAGQKGTGKWMSQIALDLGVPIP